MSNLTNNVALVTGGSRGIGAGLAKRLAPDGARLAITYTRDSEAAAQVEGHRGLGRRDHRGPGGAVIPKAVEAATRRPSRLLAASTSW